MIKVLTAEQMREVDRLTTERYGIPSIILMENAAHAVARVITEKLGGSVKGKSILILCGKGNNGGDGAALARILWQAGAEIDIFLLGTVKETHGDARINFDIVKRLSERELQVEPSLNLHEYRDSDWRTLPEFCHHTVFVDALFGTGLTRPLDEATNHFVARLRNQKNRELAIAIDIPSGLDSDSSEVIGPVFPADVTVTFTAPKLASVLPPAAGFNGELIVAKIGTPSENFDLEGYIKDFGADLLVTESQDVRDWLITSKFSHSDYKNKRGHAVIFAGSDNYSGAAVMCGNSAMRSGVGLTTLLVPASCKTAVASRVIPEVIVGTIGDNADEFAKADSILIGPGLDANDPEIAKLVHEVVSTRRVPVIVDAGAFGVRTLLSASPVPPARKKGEDQVDDLSPEPSLAAPFLNAEAASMRTGVSALQALILTPHEGEFLRLLGTEDKDAIKDRVAAVRNFAISNRVILVLKGERVLIGSPDGRVVVNPTGNSGLGKAGNGDTLAGILAGFVAQAVKFDIDIFETVVAAVFVAGMAGDVAEKKYGKRVMTASDVRECLVEVFEEFEK